MHINRMGVIGLAQELAMYTLSEGVIQVSTVIGKCILSKGRDSR